MIQERLKALREEMAQRSIDIYIVPTSDFHESEYCDGGGTLDGRTLFCAGGKAA